MIFKLALFLLPSFIAASCSEGGFRGSQTTKKTEQDPKSKDSSEFPKVETVQELDTLSPVDGKVDCEKIGSSFEIDDWKPYINAPLGYLYNKKNVDDLKTVKTSGDGNVVLASANDLAVGAEFPGKSYLLSGYELYNDTGEKNHFGKGWAVEVSTDGKNWTTVEQRVEGLLGIQKYSFAQPILASYVRMRLTELPYGAGWDVWWLKFFGHKVDCK